MTGASNDDGDGGAQRRRLLAGGWKDLLLANAAGAPKPLLANAITALRDAPEWQHVFAFDEFSGETVIGRAPPWVYPNEDGWEPRTHTSQDDILVADWLQRQGIAVNVPTAAQAVETAARDRPFHPVVDYLAGLEFDGVPRVDDWLETYLGAAPTDYNSAVGRAMLIAAVARIMRPGVKVDTVPILEGAQGARKSTAIRTLFDPWFTDDLADLGSKDCALQMRGRWGVEVSELDAMSRVEISRVKAFISRATDRFRPPYGSRVIEAPRSCVFWGSTNSDGYLKDETGGRRFWPIKVGRVDIEGLRRDRDHLWAEAAAMFAAGAVWWIVNPQVMADAEHQQRERYAGDLWDERVAGYVASVEEVTIPRVLTECLALELGRCGQIEMNRIARILKSLGLVRVQRRAGDKRTWVYRKPMHAGDSGYAAENVTAFRPVTDSQVVTRQTAVAAGAAP